jgi:hypothetical protein
VNELLTWEFLGTFAGATLVVSLLVQFFKLQVDKVWKIPTKYLVYILSVFVLVLAQIFGGTFSASNLVITFFNAFGVTLSAMGFYDITFKKYDEQKG